jgi:hypothetical protein
MSRNGGISPSLPSTECSCAFNPVRSRHSLWRYRTNSRSCLVESGAIHDSGKDPRRNKLASISASTRSFFTLRFSKPLIPNGCAKCTSTPSSARTSTAQYQPQVASITTTASGPASDTTPASICGELSNRLHHKRLPPSSRHTAKERRRCRSIPT